MTGASISVVIPCYNAARYIGATLRSVLAQGWPNLEVIVVDDGSADASADIVARDFPSVTLIRQANAGVASARNIGIRHASGDWVAFLDADDVWLPGKLAAQWQRLSSEPETRMAYSAWQVWASEAPIPLPEDLAVLLAESDDAVLWDGPSGWIYPQLLVDCVVWTSTVLAQRSLFDEIGMFDPGLPVGEDYDLWLRASRVTPIARVARPLALYRIHPGSITKRAPAANHRSVVVERALERWGCVGPDGACARREDVQRALAASWSDYAAAHLKVGNVGEARAGGLMSTRADWHHVPGWKVLVKAWGQSLRAPRMRHP